jgi:8-hydroxy-5-deazaflavin:NADPH oxidoreductase
MDVAVIGTGSMGRGLVALFTRAGHNVAVASQSGSNRPAELAAEFGARAAASPRDAVADADLVVLVPLFGSFRALERDLVDGQVVVDAMNYYPERDGEWPEIQEDGRTSSELVQEHFRAARLVKAFNTLGPGDYVDRADRNAQPALRTAVWVASDDGGAKQLVANAIDSVGLTAVDAGALSERHDWFSEGSPVYGRAVTAREAEELLVEVAS